MKPKRVYSFLAVIFVALVLIIYFNYSALYDAWYYATKPALPRAVSYLEQTLDRVEDIAVAESIASSSEVTEHSSGPTPDATSTPAPAPILTSNQVTASTTAIIIQKLSKPLAAELNLAVPFQPQAPFGNWSEPYQDACEEASMIMVDHYLRGVGLTKQEMKDEIDQRIAWETKNWGYAKNLSIEKVQTVSQVFYSHKTEILADLTLDKIKLELNLGRPVIVPLAARFIHNPNFIAPGPIYHVIVLKGYTTSGMFIANDPGTHLGADYLYDENVIMSAIHDWTGVSPSGPRIGFIMHD